MAAISKCIKSVKSDEKMRTKHVIEDDKRSKRRLLEAENALNLATSSTFSLLRKCLK